MRTPPARAGVQPLRLNPRPRRRGSLVQFFSGTLETCPTTGRVCNATVTTAPPGLTGSGIIAHIRLFEGRSVTRYLLLAWLVFLPSFARAQESAATSKIV